MVAGFTTASQSNGGKPPRHNGLTVDFAGIKKGTSKVPLGRSPPSGWDVRG